jgi:hypothetical protein
MKSLVYLLSLTFPIISVTFVRGQNDPALTEKWLPVPPVITPVVNNAPPSDAIVLFDGSSLDQWENEKGGEAEWVVKNGEMTVKPGSGIIRTRASFADCQLHIEWKTPVVITGDGQGRGNSGIFLQDTYEVQVLDSYNNITYSNGQAGSVYKQHIPMVNACLKPGEWQVYDIIYTAPRFNMNGTLKSPAWLTVIHNGVLIQNHVQLKGHTPYTGDPSYTPHAFKLPLSLQDHGNEVSFRNIWIREINAIKLFDPSQPDSWYTYLANSGINKDPEKTIKVENDLISIEGKYFGYLCTRDSYSDYYLRAEFKWGTRKYAPRDKDKRDSGILYHFKNTEKDTIWPKAVECQVQEGDCGDYWCIGTSVDSPNTHELTYGMKRIIRTENAENPNGEWNTLEVICSGDQSQHFVNGKRVNSGSRLSATKGRILLQSEGAEVYYRNVQLIPF